MISRTRFSTLIPRGIHGHQKTPDKPITRPSQRNKPETGIGQKENLENKFVYLLQDPMPGDKKTDDAEKAEQVKDGQDEETSEAVKAVDPEGAKEVAYKTPEGPGR